MIHQKLAKPNPAACKKKHVQRARKISIVESAMARASSSEMQWRKNGHDRVLDISGWEQLLDNSRYGPTSVEFIYIFVIWCHLNWFEGAQHSIIKMSRWVAERAANVYKIFFPKRRKNSITMRMQVCIFSHNYIHIYVVVSLAST